MPNRNHGQYIAAALDGLLNQTVLPAEIWVVDDASTDYSRDIIAHYAARNSVIKPRLLPECRGVIENMLTFLHNTDAEFVYFAASDDQIMPQLIEESLALLLRYPEAGLCSSLCRLMGEDGSDLGSFPSFVPPSQDGFISPALTERLFLDFDSWIMGNTIIYRRNHLLAAGCFDPSLQGFTDGFSARVIALTHGVTFAYNELAYWRRLDMGFSSTTNSDPACVHQVADETMLLMTTKHAKLFSPAYRKRWRGRWIYSAVNSCLNAGGNDPWPNIIKIMAPTSTTDQLAIKLCLRVGKPGKFFFWIYIILRLRPIDIYGMLNITLLKSWWRRRQISSRHGKASN
jgi:glycosyltransferase involved in cell wall biosynthesis